MSATPSVTRLRRWSMPELRLLMDSFELVAVRINHEGCVVGGAVVWPQSRWTVVLPARRQRSRMKSIDRLAARRVEGKVKAGTGRPGIGALEEESQFALPRPAKADAFRLCPVARPAKRLHDGIVEAARPL